MSRTSGFSDQSFQTVTEVNNGLEKIISEQSKEIINYQHALHELSFILEKSKYQLLEVLAEKKKIMDAKETIAKEIKVKDKEISSISKKLEKMSSLDALNAKSTPLSLNNCDSLSMAVPAGDKNHNFLPFS